MKGELIDKQLIQNFILGDRNAANDLYLRHKKHVFSITYKYSKNKEISEEIVQETFLEAFKIPNRLKKINNFRAWLAKIAKNKGIDYSRRAKKEKEIGIKIKTSEEKTNESPEKRFVEKKYKDMSSIAKMEISNPEFLKEIKRSLDYILCVYRLKEEYDFTQKNLLPFLKVRFILDETRSNIENIFRLPSEKEVMRTYRTLRSKFSKEDKREMDSIFREPINYLSKLEFLKGPFIENHNKKLKEVRKQYGWSPKKMLEVTLFPEELKRSLNQLYFWQDNKEFFNLSLQYLNELIKKLDEEIQERSSFQWVLVPNEFRSLLSKADRINIEAPVLIFRVWIRAFKIGKKTNLKLIKSVMLEFKKQYKNTLWNDLFIDLDESFNVETWRKKILKFSSNNSFYNELSGLIYRMSFVEKIPIYPWR